jgi:hypothetical protein
MFWKILFVFYKDGSRDSVVSIVARLWAGQCGMHIPVERREFVFQNVHTSSGAHPASYSKGIKGSFLRVNQPERNVNHRVPFIANLGIVGVVPLLP